MPPESLKGFSNKHTLNIQHKGVKPAYESVAKLAGASVNTQRSSSQSMDVSKQASLNKAHAHHLRSAHFSLGHLVNQPTSQSMNLSDY